MSTRPSLKFLLRDVLPVKLKQPCRDDHLSKIALSLTDWQSIAPFLDLTEADEEGIKRDYPNTKTQKIAVLRKWKNRFGKKANYGKLVSVFWELERADLVEIVCELLRMESSSSSSDEDIPFVLYNTPLTGPSTANGEHSCQKITLDSYAKYLRGRYSTDLPKFFTLQWPPPPTHKVFNLAMIGHQTIQRGPIDEELVRLTLRGNVDDVMRRKSSIKLENIFDGNKKRKIILIEGAPGAGKSTLAWHICQKWESGELFQEFKFVIFIQLRDPAVQAATSLVDILPVKSEEMRKEVWSQMESRNGCDVLFVLDGWDEYGVSQEHHSLIKQLICSPQEMNMHFSARIITSRPIASGELQQFVSSRVEIIGFTSKEVKRYFREAIGDNETVQKLEGHLVERPVIQASCYLPLNAAIVVHLFFALNYTLPDTLHEVFLSLVRCCIIRHLTKGAEGRQKVPSIPSLDVLPPDIQEPFKNICAMAYHGVMKNKATFSATDLQSFDLPTELNTLSLIQGVQSFAAFEQTVSCNFLHLSVQELLAAFHVSKLPAPKQIQIFNDLFDQPRLAAVFRFYAAFTKLQTEGVRDVVTRMVKKEQKPLLINLLHCLYEAQDPSLCEFVASRLSGELDLSNNTLSPMDCLVVGYFISCICLTASGEFAVKLCSCSLDEYRVRFLVGELNKCESSLKSLRTLNLDGNNLSDGSAVHISGILRDNQSLKSLGILDCGISDKGMKTLASALERCHSLEELDLSLNGNAAVTSVGLMALGESLKKIHRLRTLCLGLHTISDNDWVQFLMSLHYSHKLLLPSRRCLLRRELLMVRRENSLPLLILRWIK